MNASSVSNAVTTRLRGRHALAFFALLAITLTGLAPLAARADVPGRVGRISFMSGDVQAYSETEPEWKVAYVNEPITSRNSIFVGDSGRAEISIGSTTLAMDAGSQVDIQQLDDNTLNANVVRGRVSLRVRNLDRGDEYHVAVPGADFALLRPGRYRIDALESGSGITVFEGQAGVQNDRNSVTVDAGNAMRVVAGQDPNGPAQLLSAAPVPATLDDWVLAREARFRNSQAERYVSPNMTGYEDLDANGRWASEPDVGPVWYPTTYVTADWAPYRHGRWAYVAPWGYTWVDDAPWGFAPFHYGRWLEVGGRWGWCPGAYVARPAYAPALVGFYGGAGFSATFAVGAGPAVGWYPLAPWERFNPHYAHNTTYVNQVNNITIVNPPARYAAGGPGGWNRERGATIVPQQAFASQRSINRVAAPAPRGMFERASLVDANALPRPSSVPGAIRRGPEPGVGNARPEFRSPQEFARAPERQRGPDGQRQEAQRQEAARPSDQPRGGGAPNGQQTVRPGQPGQPSFGDPSRAGERGGPQRNEAQQTPRPGQPGQPSFADPSQAGERGNLQRNDRRFGDSSRPAEQGNGGPARPQFNERSGDRQRADDRPQQQQPQPQQNQQQQFQQMQQRALQQQERQAQQPQPQQQPQPPQQNQQQQFQQMQQRALQQQERQAQQQERQAQQQQQQNQPQNQQQFQQMQQRALQQQERQAQQPPAERVRPEARGAQPQAPAAAAPPQPQPQRVERPAPAPAPAAQPAAAPRERRNEPGRPDPKDDRGPGR